MKLNILMSEKSVFSKHPKNKGQSFVFLTLISSLFLLISLAGGVFGVECNADLSQGGNSCTVSSSLTLNGSYVINMNGTSSGAITISGSNLIFDCNGTTIYGNNTA